MNPKQKADQLIAQYKILLMNEDTECGNEILCTTIAIKSALVTVDKILTLCDEIKITDQKLKLTEFWNQVKIEINNY
jgi:hypothetical protein